MKLLFLLIVFLFGMVDFVRAEDYCCGYYSPGNPFECTTHDDVGRPQDHGNCTWWAAFKRSDVSPPCIGDAEKWLTQAGDDLPKGSLPIPGSIAVFGWEPSGHVAYVESVNPDGSFNVTEMGHDTFNCMRENTYLAGSATGFILPTQITAYSVFPETAPPGKVLTLTFTIKNFSLNPIPGILLGARIRLSNSQEDWKDDSDNDRIVTIDPGELSYSRFFKISETIKPGLYDVGWVIVNTKNNGWLDKKESLAALTIFSILPSPPENLRIISGQ